MPTRRAGAECRSLGRPMRMRAMLGGGAFTSQPPVTAMAARLVCTPRGPRCMGGARDAHGGAFAPRGSRRLVDGRCLVDARGDSQAIATLALHTHAHSTHAHTRARGISCGLVSGTGMIFLAAWHRRASPVTRGARCTMLQHVVRCCNLPHDRDDAQAARVARGACRASRRQGGAQPQGKRARDNGAGSWTGLIPATSARGLGSPLPHLHLDWAWPCHICTGTGLIPATSGTGLPPRQICTGTARSVRSSAPSRSRARLRALRHARRPC
jgi:hypothetical protein